MRRDRFRGCGVVRGGYGCPCEEELCWGKPVKATLALPTAFCLLFILLSPASAQDVQLPAQPTGLTASTTAEAVSLEWDEPGDSSITGYQVLRRSRDGDAYGDDQGAPEFAIIADDTGSADTQYRDSSVTPGARYVYRIKARNAAGLSPWSSYTNAETLTAPAFQAKDAVPRSDPSTCPDSTPPTPTAVPIDAIPIVVSSTTAEYFVLYVSHEIARSQLLGVEADTPVEVPVLVKRGEASTTTLDESVAPLPKERYRLEKYLVSNPADVDGDCIDDLTELDNLGSMNPVNAAAIDSGDGAVAILDRETFQTLVYNERRGAFIKFVLLDINTDRPRVYFMNTEKYRFHRDFLNALGLDWRRPGMITGDVTYNPILAVPNSSQGAYWYFLSNEQAFGVADLAYTILAASMPLLEDNLVFHIPTDHLLYIQPYLPAYDESRINLVFEAELYGEDAVRSMNPGEGYGLLRVMGRGRAPQPTATW